MKKNKIGFVLVFGIIFCVNCSAQSTTGNNTFGLGDGILGSIINNVVQFHYFSFNNETWSRYSDMDFLLPNGNRGVFGLGDGILGVIVNNVVQFHYFSFNNETWSRYSDMDHALNQ